MRMIYRIPSQLRESQVDPQTERTMNVETNAICCMKNYPNRYRVQTINCNSILDNEHPRNCLCPVHSKKYTMKRENKDLQKLEECYWATWKPKSKCIVLPCRPNRVQQYATDNYTQCRCCKCSSPRTFTIIEEVSFPTITDCSSISSDCNCQYCPQKYECLESDTTEMGFTEAGMSKDHSMDDRTCKYDKGVHCCCTKEDKSIQGDALSDKASRENKTEVAVRAGDHGVNHGFKNGIERHEDVGGKPRTSGSEKGRIGNYGNEYFEHTDHETKMGGAQQNRQHKNEITGQGENQEDHLDNRNSVLAQNRPNLDREIQQQIEYDLHNAYHNHRENVENQNHQLNGNGFQNLGESQNQHHNNDYGKGKIEEWSNGKQDLESQRTLSKNYYDQNNTLQPDNHSYYTSRPEEIPQAAHEVSKSPKLFSKESFGISSYPTRSSRSPPIEDFQMIKEIPSGNTSIINQLKPQESLSTIQQTTRQFADDQNVAETPTTVETRNFEEMQAFTEAEEFAKSEGYFQPSEFVNSRNLAESQRHSESRQQEQEDSKTTRETHLNSTVFEDANSGSTVDEEQQQEKYFAPLTNDSTGATVSNEPTVEPVLISNQFPRESELRNHFGQPSPLGSVTAASKIPGSSSKLSTRYVGGMRHSYPLGGSQLKGFSFGLSANKGRKK